jgi:hypothetical protein
MKVLCSLIVVGRWEKEAWLDIIRSRRATTRLTVAPAFYITALSHESKTQGDKVMVFNPSHQILQSIRDNVTERADLQFSQTMPDYSNLRTRHLDPKVFQNLTSWHMVTSLIEVARQTFCCAGRGTWSRSRKVRIPHLYLSRRIDRQVTKKDVRL